MVCLLTPDHQLTFANRSFRERFGEPPGCICDCLCPDLTRSCDACDHFNVLSTGRPRQWEMTTPNGAVLEVHDHPFLDTDGSRLVLEMNLDITQRRNAETALQRADQLRAPAGPG